MNEQETLHEQLNLWRQNLAYWETEMAREGGEPNIKIFNRINEARGHIRELERRIDAGEAIDLEQASGDIVPMLAWISVRVERNRQDIDYLLKRVPTKPMVVSFVLTGVMAFLGVGHWLVRDFRLVYLGSGRGLGMGIAITLMFLIIAGVTFYLGWEARDDRLR